MQGSEVLGAEALLNIVTGIIVGTMARYLTLKQDYRQYPSYPNGRLIHLTTGFVAAGLGAVAIPALISKNFVAVTFLALAIQQFRDTRRSERDSLTELEKTEFAPRGAAYIDGIAKTFEARNYFALITSLIATSVMYAAPLTSFLRVMLALFAGGLAGLLLKRFSLGNYIRDIASVDYAELTFKDCDLYVGHIFVKNIGMEQARERIIKEGFGVIVTPLEEHLAVSLNNFGQRQAIVHEVARALGVKRTIGTRRDFETGQVALVVVPIRRDTHALIEAIKRVPLLESTRKSKTLLEGKD